MDKVDGRLECFAVSLIKQGKDHISQMLCYLIIPNFKNWLSHKFFREAVQEDLGVLCH